MIIEVEAQKTAKVLLLSADVLPLLQQMQDPDI